MWTTELLALLRLAGPVILSQFASNALALIATAVIGRLGAAELAAAAYANAAYYLVFMMLVGVMLSVAPRVSQAHGAGDTAGVTRALHAGLRLALLLGAAVLPVVWGVAALLPHLAPADIRSDLAATYLRVYSLGMLPTLAFMALRGTLEGTAQAGHADRFPGPRLGRRGQPSPGLRVGAAARAGRRGGRCRQCFRRLADGRRAVAQRPETRRA